MAVDGWTSPRFCRAALGIRLLGEPFARLVLGPEYLGRPVRPGKIDDTRGDTVRRAAGDNEGDGAAWPEIGAVGAHARAQHHDVVVVQRAHGTPAVDQLAVRQGALQDNVVEEVLEVLQPRLALGPGLDLALAVIDRELDRHAP